MPNRPFSAMWLRTTPTQPAGIANRVSVHCKQWVEELSAGGVRVRTKTLIEVNVTGIGQTLAYMVLRRVGELAANAGISISTLTGRSNLERSESHMARIPEDTKRCKSRSYSTPLQRPPLISCHPYLRCIDTMHAHACKF